MKLTPQEIKNAISEHESKIQELQEELKKSSYVTGFERVDNENEYSIITSRGNIFTDYPDDEEEDCEYFNIANYGQEKRMNLLEKMNRLQRLLYRFSAENGGDNIDWSDKKQEKWCINFKHDKQMFEIDYWVCSIYSNTIYFISEDVAEQALEKFRPLMLEIIKEQEEVKKYYLDLNSKEKLTSSHKFPLERQFIVGEDVWEVADIGEDETGVIYDIREMYDEESEVLNFTESELEQIILRGSFDE